MIDDVVCIYLFFVLFSFSLYFRVHTTAIECMMIQTSSFPFNSAPYGFRPQSLGTSYLYDRTNNEEAGPATDANPQLQRGQDGNNKMDSSAGNLMKTAN